MGSLLKDLFTISRHGHFTRLTSGNMSVLNLLIYFVSMHLIGTGQMMSIYLSLKMTYYMPS